MKIGTTTRNFVIILNWNSGFKSLELTKRQSRYIVLFYVHTTCSIPLQQKKFPQFVTFVCPTKSYSVHLCTLLPTPPPVEHNCEPGFLHLFNFLSVCELPLQSNTRQNCMCRWCLHDRQCNPTKGWGVWNIFVRSTDMEENNGLKAGWQINSATSLNIYLCRLEIISCCEMSIKKLPLLHYFSSGNFLACQGNIPNSRSWRFSLFLCKITCKIGSKFNQTHPECIICYWISIININSSFQSLLPWRVNLVLVRLLNLIFIFCLLSF